VYDLTSQTKVLAFTRSPSIGWLPECSFSGRLSGSCKCCRRALLDWILDRRAHIRDAVADRWFRRKNVRRKNQDLQRSVKFPGELRLLVFNPPARAVLEILQNGNLPGDFRLDSLRTQKAIRTNLGYQLNSSLDISRLVK